MGLLEDILGDKGSELTGSLVDNAGFSAEQAQDFLPPAVGQVLEAVGGGGVDFGELLDGGGISALLSKIDLGALASQTGVDAAKAGTGLQALVPLVVSALQDKAGGADGILSLLGGGKSGALGALGGLAGKLFKR
jgi:hypothetical protein